MLTRAFTAACAALLSACTAMQGGAQLHDWPTGWNGAPPADGIAFTGLVGARRDGSDGGGETQHAREIYVFVIHGMGLTVHNYNDVMGERLAELNFVQGAVEGWTPIDLPERYIVSGEGVSCNGSPCSFAAFGELQVANYSRVRDDINVHVYTYYWHEDMWRVQQGFLSADMGVDDVGRAWLNGTLKRDTINGGFSDAVAYLGPMGPLAREGVRGAVCEMLKAAFVGDSAQGQGTRCLATLDGAPGPGVEFVFLSHSLGSRMLLDSLAPFASAPNLTRREVLGMLDAAPTMDRVADHTSSIYMAANQIPLLGIAQVNVRPASQAFGFAEADVSNSQAFAEALDACPTLSFLSCRDASLQLDVIGFHDPDDLLGYRGNSGLLAGVREQPEDAIGNMHFINVTHRNANQWLRLFAWPQEAHDKEMERDSSASLIMCGATVDARRRLHARAC